MFLNNFETKDKEIQIKKLMKNYYDHRLQAFNSNLKSSSPVIGQYLKINKALNLIKKKTKIDNLQFIHFKWKLTKLSSSIEKGIKSISEFNHLKTLSDRMRKWKANIKKIIYRE